LEGEKTKVGVVYGLELLENDKRKICTINLGGGGRNMGEA